MVNPIHSGVKTLQLGRDMAISGHLGLVYQKYTTDEHGMKLEYVTKDGMQNWASAQYICQTKFRDFLRHLHTIPNVHEE